MAPSVLNERNKKKALGKKSESEFELEARDGRISEYIASLFVHKF